VTTKLQKQKLLPNGGNFKLNLISRRTGKPVTFNMVDLDKIDNCSVSRIINYDGVELGKDWVQNPKNGFEEQKESKKRKPMHEENFKSAQCVQNQNVDVVTLDEEVEDDLVTLEDEEVDDDDMLVNGLQGIVSESFQERDEQDMLDAMDLDLDISDDPHQAQGGSPKMSEPSGFHQALAYLSSLPSDSWTEVERTEWRGKDQRRGIEDEIFGGKVRMPSWGVLHPEESLTRPASLEEADPDLYQSLASLEDRLASSLEETWSSSTADWRCDCKVEGKRENKKSVCKHPTHLFQVGKSDFCAIFNLLPIDQLGLVFDRRRNPIARRLRSRLDRSIY